MVLDGITIIAFFVIITVLFRYAAGSLGVRSLNLINTTYYIFAIQGYLGTSLAYLGLNSGHYIISVIPREAIELAMILVIATGIALPLVVIFWNVVFGNFDMKKRWHSFVDQGISRNIDEKKLQLAVLLMMLVVVASTVYTFSVIGYVPMLDVLFGGSSGAAADLRADASRGFAGNVYIRGFGMIALAPLTSFFCLAGLSLFGGRRWRALFLASIALAFIALTYDLEKSPSAYFVFALFVLSQILGKKWSVGRTALIIGSLAGILVLAYLVVYGISSISLSFESGLLSRLTSTSAGALMLHLTVFPEHVQFLDGSGLPGFSHLFGSDPDAARSSRIVMYFFNSGGVEAGTAGVMNAMFVGEAYANWGMVGVIFAIVVVGTCIGVSHNCLIQLDKSITAVLLYITLVRLNILMLFGGFADYLYNSTMLVSVATILLVSLFANKKRVIDIRLSREPVLSS
ncbi:MAG: hypothetical protein UCH28_09145 [Adlercreutzia sp.]|nr:hypothetical protein [Adlercreutzia sp.]